MERKLYTISAYSENNIGVLNQVTVVFTRRGINIESITASTTSIPGIFKITLTARGTRDEMEKAVRQIEKCIDILRAFLHDDSEVVYQEVALYKVPTEALMHESSLEQIIRRHNARILEITPVYTIVEATGHEDETQALFDELRRFGILQFVRSGRVTVTKHPVEFMTNFLENQAKIEASLPNQNPAETV